MNDVTPQSTPRTMRNMTNYVCGWLIVAAGLGTMVWVDFMDVWSGSLFQPPDSRHVAEQILLDMLMIPGAYSFLVRPKVMVAADSRWTVVNPFSRWDFMEEEILDIRDVERFQRIHLKSGKRIFCVAAEESLFARMRGTSSVKVIKTRRKKQAPELSRRLEGGFSLDVLQVLMLLVVLTYYGVGIVQWL